MRPVPEPTMNIRVGASELLLAKLCPARSATVHFLTGHLCLYSQHHASALLGHHLSLQFSSQVIVAGCGPPDMAVWVV